MQEWLGHEHSRLYSCLFPSVLPNFKILWMVCLNMSIKNGQPIRPIEYKEICPLKQITKMTKKYNNFVVLHNYAAC